METPIVSINTPTKNRHHFLPLIKKCVESQNFENLEWLVLDDTNERFKPLESNSAPNIKYIHSNQKITIGEKRNILISEAKGNIIVNFDDDDFYAPQYVTNVVDTMLKHNFDFLNLRGFFLHHCKENRYGYWDLTKQNGMHYQFGPDEFKIVEFNESKNRILPNLSISYGFGYSYRKVVWDNFKVPDLDWKEDVEFALKIKNDFRLGGLFDNQGLCMHFIHDYNTSRSFPQYIIPEILINRFFDRKNINEYVTVGRHRK